MILLMISEISYILRPLLFPVECLTLLIKNNANVVCRQNQIILSSNVPNLVNMGPKHLIEHDFFRIVWELEIEYSCILGTPPGFPWHLGTQLTEKQ